MNLKPIPTDDEGMQRFKETQVRMTQTVRGWIAGSVICVSVGLFLSITTHHWLSFWLCSMAPLGLLLNVGAMRRFCNQSIPMKHYRLTGEGFQFGISVSNKEVQWAEVMPYGDLVSVYDRPGEIILEFGQGGRMAIPEACFETENQREIFLARTTKSLETTLQ